MQSPQVVRWACLLFALGVLQSGQASAKDCIGVVPASAHVFWQQVEAGARRAGVDAGIELYVRGPRKEGSVATQLQLIDKVLEQGCKALVIAPAGAEINAKARELEARGVLTFYIDRDVGGDDVQALIATNNYRAGQAAGRHVAQRLGSEGRVGLIRMTPEIASTSARQRGFIQAVEAAGLTIAFDRPLGDPPQATFEALHDQLPRLDALFTPNGSSTRLTYAALLRMQEAGQLLHIGFDADQVLLDALRAGQIDALMVQQPYAMGYQGVLLAERALRTGRVEPRMRRIELDAVLVTRDNLDSPGIKTQLQLPKQP
ncbi:substrate-binding domain-containing protein [Pseudomonas sp. LPB0260]|uniref:substrate-binding domain-containing protein n=1 Tax=Pseudomonas sp. LPB0260 TaxID=2614442 RepID=UPI0015C2092F|nr:substrate-binding domain-containing protein [Pseudomonas sp. LPB0260]QLC73596.1 substrate-binding domain-containing protein [Pseudomonas sp. LPB0260]QLC76370.1 substrate-binding domain-containing protein [Pseudomonas sp. LPB0260]